MGDNKEEKKARAGGYTVYCKHQDEDGMCTGRYEGYVCLEDKCPFYRMILEGECRYLRDGGYCTYYRRFHCPGLGECEITFGMRLIKEEIKEEKE